MADNSGSAHSSETCGFIQKLRLTKRITRELLQLDHIAYNFMFEIEIGNNKYDVLNISIKSYQTPQIFIIHYYF